MDTLLAKSPESKSAYIKTCLLTSPTRLKCRNSDLKLPFRKIEQVRDYYLDQINLNSKLECKNSPIYKSRMRSLEDLGIFSKLGHSKKIYSENMQNKSPRTIHITDFMRKDQKMKLLKLGEHCKAFESKKEVLKRELKGSDFVFKNFFYQSDKNQALFSTPQALPRGFKDMSVNDSPRVVGSEKKVKLDRIIDECTQVIAEKVKFNLVIIKD